MARSFFQSILAWFAGTAIGLILTALFLKIGWLDKERILLLGYGGLTSVLVFYAKFSGQIKKEELDAIYKKFESKAERTELMLLQAKMDSILDNQEEQHTTIEHIYNILLEERRHK
jgi:ABC-type nitrate/sulfonate/bicarbonate transport system substrate-binding protein